MAVADAGLDHRNRRPGDDPIDQIRTSPRDHDIDGTAGVDQVVHRAVTFTGDQLHRQRGQANGGQGGPHAAHQGLVGGSRAGGSPQERRVATLETQRGRVDGHVRPCLVDHADHTHGHTDLLHLEPVGQAVAAHHLSDGVLQFGDHTDGRHDLLQSGAMSRSRSRSPGGCACRLRPFEVHRVGGHDGIDVLALSPSAIAARPRFLSSVVRARSTRAAGRASAAACWNGEGRCLSHPTQGRSCREAGPSSEMGRTPGVSNSVRRPRWPSLPETAAIEHLQPHDRPRRQAQSSRC